jgi:zinc protease
MLAGILSGGASARFPQRLVREQQVAAKVSAGYNPAARISDIFIIDGTPTQEHTAEELEMAVRGEVQRLRDELVSVKELDRVKAQVMASEVYERDSIFYQAMKIGTVETIGLEWKVLDNYLENIQAVTAEQVQAVARKYLVDDKLTVALLDPQPIENNKPRHTMQGGGSHAR